MNRDQSPQTRYHVRISKFLSLVLRHKPDHIGLTLDAEGWAEIDDLLSCAKPHFRDLDRELLEKVVRENDKQRFAISDDGIRIRASQGHSIQRVQLNLEPKRPPEILFHGTVARFLNSIKEKGLLPGSRNHVHLSQDCKTAEIVGKRRGKPVLLIVQSHAMFTAGKTFYLSDNGVWLTENVQPRVPQIPELKSVLLAKSASIFGASTNGYFG